MPIESPVLNGQKGGEKIRVDVGQRYPASERAISGARSPEWEATAVKQHEPGCGRVKQVGRQGTFEPNADPGCSRADDGHGDQRGAVEGAWPYHLLPAGFGVAAFGVTVKTPPSLSPNTAGLYISSAWAGGRMNTPGVVARAT
jgi:hypothetical protein